MTVSRVSTEHFRSLLGTVESSLTPGQSICNRYILHRMGACLSRGNESGIGNVDDSVHVMLAHDRKKRKESGIGNGPGAGYKPRASNPALERKRDENNGTAASEEEKTEETANVE